MKITLKEANDGFPALVKLNERSFPIDKAYKLAKLHDAIKSEIITYEKTAQKKVAELGLDKELPEDPDRAVIAKRRMDVQAYREESSALLESTEIEVPDVKVKLAELGDAPITPAALVGLDFLIEE